MLVTRRWYNSISQLIHLLESSDSVWQLEHAFVVFEAFRELELILGQDRASIFILFLFLFVGYAWSCSRIEWRETDMHGRSEQVVGRLKVAIPVLKNSLKALFLIASILCIGANDAHLVLHGAWEERSAKERVCLIESRDISLRLARNRQVVVLHKAGLVRLRWLCSPATIDCAIVGNKLIADGVTLVVDKADQRGVVVFCLQLHKL